ncbi:MAG TPA: endonuclease/exonuclease/phosphatase family protein, partial [Vicinamibacterales bacterium]|nr:endonuclease/exonuclease/phosphatase family protein [Vicinamibacterales bacterium]
LSLAPQASQPPAPVTSEFRIMTFNIQHGLDNDGSYDLQWAARTIAALHPDLVGVQELTRNHPTYHCQDQPAEIARTLSAATSRRWTYIYKEEWTTKVGDCHGDTPETEGNGFFAPSPLSKAGSVDMWNGRNGLEVVLPVAGGLPIVTTHLQSGLLPQNSADRLRQLGTLLPWTRRLGTPRILICDCNAKPTTPEYAQLHAMYHDAWADAVAAGTAKGRADGITHKHSRIDYVFYDPGTRLRLVSVETVETPALVGREASDHRPVVATFAVR